MKNFSDKELLKAYQFSGNEVAFGKLYRKYLEKIYHVCLYFYKNEEVAKDAVMDIFEKVMTSAKNYEIDNFENWLKQVAVNHCKKNLSKQKKAALLLEELYQKEPNFFLAEEADSTTYVNKQFLQSCINKLSSFQKSCILLFYFEGLTYKEISQYHSIEEKRVKSYIENGRRNLKSLLSNTMYSIYN